MTKPDHTPADEKAVAELFKCDCGYDEASATCFDSGHDLGCKSRHSDVGTALAARIRADAERETERLRKVMSSASASVRSAFRINANPESKPWNRQHLCDFLDGIADTLDAALKEKA